MDEELKLALQALSAISAKDTRMENMQKVLRLYQRVQRMVSETKELSCGIYYHKGYVSLAMHYYEGSTLHAELCFLHSFSTKGLISSHVVKKFFFDDLHKFIQEVKDYEYRKSNDDPTKACILP